MSIYGSVVFNESYNGKPVITDTIESIMEDDSIVLKDENEDFVTEGLEAVAVMTENYSNFMQRVGVSELSAIYATGDEMIYTENVVTDFFGAIKRFVMKIWEKIKSLFKRFMMVIDSYTKNDKAFINKYRQQIYRHKSLSDFTFKGYKYTIPEDKITSACNRLAVTEGAKAYGKVGNASTNGYSAGYNMNRDFDDAALRGDTNDQDNKHYLKHTAGVAAGVGTPAVPEKYEFQDEYSRKRSDKLDDELEKLRGEVIGDITGKSGGALTNEEFNKELKEALRNGESEKQELDEKDIDVDKMVTEVQTNRDTKKKADRLFRDTKKCVDTTIKDLDRHHKEHIRNLPGDQTRSDNDKAKDKALTAAMNYQLRWQHGAKAILISLSSGVLQALKERNRQNKACLVKIAYHNPKNEDAYIESYDHSSYNNYNFISNIQFK